MTMTRSAIIATTPKSWVMMRTDIRISSRMRLTRSRNCFCARASRFVVGSSAISSLGWEASAMARTTR